MLLFLTNNPLSSVVRTTGQTSVRFQFPVASVVAMVADGMEVDEILTEHSSLEADDVRQALHYAALTVQERQLPLLSA